MNSTLLLKHIHDFNLSYLLLAQKLVNEDRVLAMYRLGIDKEVADTLTQLTSRQLMKLAETNQLICRFRFNDRQTITRLTQESRVDGLQQMHTGILLSGSLLNSIMDKAITK